MCTTFRCINSLFSFGFLLTAASLSTFYRFRLWFADWITCCFQIKPKKKNVRIAQKRMKASERVNGVHDINANGMRNTCSTCMSLIFVRLIYSLSQSASRFVFCAHIFVFRYIYAQLFHIFNMWELLLWLQFPERVRPTGFTKKARSNATCKQLLWPTTIVCERVPILFFLFRRANLLFCNMGMVDSISCNERVWSVTVTTNQWFKCIWKLKTKNRTTHTHAHMRRKNHFHVQHINKISF